MALSRITKVGGNSLEDPLNFTGGINAVGVLTATGGIDAIGIQSGGVTITSGIITALNFVGTGNTFAVRGNTVDISISGGGGGIQLYDNVIDSDVEISLPYKTAAMFVDRDLTVDIESGVTVSVDDGCYFNIVAV
jgi:hypothetical protein